MIKWLLGVFLTVATLLAITEYPLVRNYLMRTATGVDTPSNAKMSAAKRDVLLARSPASQQPMGKGSALVDVKIEGRRDSSRSGGYELIATVEAKADMNDLKFVWLLPDGSVTATSGALDGTLGSLPAGQTTTVKLSIAGDNLENKQVNLHVFKMVDGEAMGFMAQYNTSAPSQDSRGFVNKVRAMRKAGMDSSENPGLHRVYQ